MSDEQPIVLIVDDNRMNIDLLVDILKDDYHLQVALDGETALEIVQDELPDIILLDIMMPGIDGYEVCKRLKSDARTKSLPIVFVTAKTQIEDEAQGLELGAVDYITKPVTPAIVRARIKTHLALHNQTRMLEEMVRERTLQLKESRDLADQASRAKSAFLANISHELRTPLNHVVGLTSLLLEINRDPEQLELIRPIKSGAEKLAALINQLLDLTELESELFEIEYGTFNLRNSLKKQEGMFRGYTEKKGLDFNFQIDERVPERVYGAPVETMQALNNILFNAFQYTEKGRIDLTVSIDPDHRAGLDVDMIMIRFSVTDTGVGIAENKLDTIFRSFEIGEDVMTKRLCGTGIGLTISKRIVEKMNGRIWVESSEGEGSTFHMTIPFRLAT